MNAVHHGPCPTCGVGHPGAPYSCADCIAAIPDPFKDGDIEGGYAPVLGCEAVGHDWADAGGGLLICTECQTEKWADS